MLAPRVVLFTPENFVGSQSRAADPVFEALSEIERRQIPLILSTSGTRAQLESLRRKIGHGHPFITESGGALFIPDAYFALRLEGAARVGRYFCVPFGRPSEEASEAVEEIAAESGAEVVCYKDMSAREISRNSGMNEREGQASREREFSERFYFAGNVDSAAPAFERIAHERHWQIRRYHPFWELYAGNDAGKAVRYLMRIYREALRSRLRSVSIASSSEDADMLAASDQAFVLPLRSGHFDEALLSRVPHAARIDAPGATGWNQAVVTLLTRL